MLRLGLIVAFAAPLLAGCLMASGGCNGEVVVQVVYTQKNYQPSASEAPPPLVSANITLYHSGGNDKGTTKTASPSGCVAFAGVAAGTYRVSGVATVPPEHCSWQEYWGVSDDFEVPHSGVIQLELDRSCIIAD